MNSTSASIPQTGPARSTSTRSASTISSLYDEITRLHGGAPWGSVLDAGTGTGSMQWLLERDTTRWTAVTGAQTMADKVQPLLVGRQREQDRLLMGNWMDPDLLAGEVYDVVLADYLLGAIDGFAPYWQDQLFVRLRPLVGKRLYIIGQEPYVPFQPSDSAGRLINNIGRLRDACILVAGGRPYREYPLDWVMRHLQAAGFRTLDALHYPIRYRERFINSQLDLASQYANKLADRVLGAALEGHIAQLRRHALLQAEQSNGLAHGNDYVIVAEPV